MADEAGHRDRAARIGKSVRFVRLSSAALIALLHRDLAGASTEAGVALTDYFVTDHALRLWRLRIRQIAADGSSARWIARAAVTEPEGIVVGHAGFHGPPDDAGMVEIAYSVDPAYRRRGYATAMLSELLRCAAAEPSVKIVRATISPDNLASLATISGFGFTEVGEQWDEEDGRELIFEITSEELPADPLNP